MRKKQYIFWVFIYSEEIIKKSDNTISWLYGLCKEMGKIQLYFSILTAWIGKNLTKRYNLSKSITIKSYLSLTSQIEFASPVIKQNIQLPFITIIPK